MEKAVFFQNWQPPGFNSAVPGRLLLILPEHRFPFLHPTICPVLNLLAVLRLPDFILNFPTYLILDFTCYFPHCNLSPPLILWLVLFLGMICVRILFVPQLNVHPIFPAQLVHLELICFFVTHNCPLYKCLIYLHSKKINHSL